MNDKPSFNKSSQKVFDVSPPHRSTPSATSRPLITAQQSLQPDPMVKVESDVQPTIDVKVDTIAETTDAELVQNVTPQTEEAAPIEEPTPKQEDVPAKSEKVELASPPEPIDTLSGAMPSVEDSQVVVSHHNTKSNAKPLLLIVALLFLAIIALDLLLDAGIIKSTLPHTHLLGR